MASASVTCGSGCTRKPGYTIQVTGLSPSVRKTDLQGALGEYGQISRIDMAGAKAAYRAALAADPQFADAQFNLGLRCAQGRGAEKDLEAAKEWLTKAAEKNHAAAPASRPCEKEITPSPLALALAKFHAGVKFRSGPAALI